MEEQDRGGLAMSGTDFLAFLLLTLALIMALRARAAERRFGLPRARTVAVDLEAGRKPAETLVSQRYRLSGRPDLILARGQAWIPVEIKPTRRARRPLTADRLQLAAYCLLLEETTGRAPAHGILCYAYESWELPYDASIRDWVLESLAAMDEVEEAGGAGRSHEEPGRCRACNLAGVCDERLDVPRG
jgi:CRISPR-associated exonuclease Cas4